MSLEAMVWALKHAPVIDAQEHLVLIGLADHAGSNGTGAWPSRATLAEYARCTERTVGTKLRRLAEAGIIRRGDQRIVGHLRADRRPVVYDLAMDGGNLFPAVHGGNDVPAAPVTGGNAASHGGNSDVARGEQPGSYGGNAVSYKPSLNRTEPSMNHSSSSATPPTACDDAVMAEAFDAFWAAYPRKTGKQAARKAFASVVRQIGRETRATVDLGVIVAGAERMAADPNLPEAQFIPHGATWLNQRRWDDPPYPARDGGPKPSTTDQRVGDAFDLARRLAEQEQGGPAALPPGTWGGAG
ncbi:helix-turn-helix domain-containing protein [Nocardioides sp. STR2]|uniref:Helix-turn-helix domain-containing protein n=1 Tax=Nocardioides pini TaxID=2975053 RepID=A0ABT4CCN3_9ACTN|nr:helix-turn-helix domain-containing protein [Nocardioides pini]MCY4726728.1 helix-turn-helix domain-containing protein [Nocardioides pini]